MAFITDYTNPKPGDIFRTDSGKLVVVMHGRDIPVDYWVSHKLAYIVDGYYPEINSGGCDFSTCYSRHKNSLVWVELPSKPEWGELCP